MSGIFFAHLLTIVLHIFTVPSDISWYQNVEGHWYAVLHGHTRVCNCTILECFDFNAFAHEKWCTKRSGANFRGAFVFYLVFLLRCVCRKGSGVPVVRSFVIVTSYFACCHMLFFPIVYSQALCILLACSFLLENGWKATKKRKIVDWAYLTSEISSMWYEAGLFIELN